MKKNIRTIGIDDAAFNRRKSNKTFVFGVVVRGCSLVEGVLRTEVQIDGVEATDKIVDMILDSKHHVQLKAIFLRSATIAAFNIIDMNMLRTKTSLPVIAILSELPNESEVKKALSNLPDWEYRLNILNHNPPIDKIEFKNQKGRDCKVFFQQVGMSEKSKIKELLRITSYSSCLPENLRLADKIGQSFKDFQLR